MLHPLTSTPLQLNGISIQRLWSTFCKYVWVFLYAQAYTSIPSNGTSVDSSIQSSTSIGGQPQGNSDSGCSVWAKMRCGQSLLWFAQQQFELLRCYMKVWEPRCTRPQMAYKPCWFGTDKYSQSVIRDNHCLNLDSGESASAGIDIQAESAFRKDNYTVPSCIYCWYEFRHTSISVLHDWMRRCYLMLPEAYWSHGMTSNVARHSLVASWRCTLSIDFDKPVVLGQCFL
jgi:hypothetical protein